MRDSRCNHVPQKHARWPASRPPSACAGPSRLSFSRPKAARVWRRASPASERPTVPVCQTSGVCPPRRPRRSLLPGRRPTSSRGWLPTCLGQRPREILGDYSLTSCEPSEGCAPLGRRPRSSAKRIAQIACPVRRDKPCKNQFNKLQVVCQETPRRLTMISRCSPSYSNARALQDSALPLIAHNGGVCIPFCSSECKRQPLDFRGDWRQTKDRGHGLVRMKTSVDNLGSDESSS